MRFRASVVFPTELDNLGESSVSLAGGRSHANRTQDGLVDFGVDPRRLERLF